MKPKDLRHGQDYLYTGGADIFTVTFTGYCRKGYAFQYEGKTLELSTNEVNAFISNVQ